MQKPTVYIASPYSIGDQGMNVHSHCRVFDELLSDGKVLPVAPLWSHFQHLLFPKPYDTWITYALEMLPLYDCCLRVPGEHDELDYRQCESAGADQEVKKFQELGKPVFTSKTELYRWLDQKAK